MCEWIRIVAANTESRTGFKEPYTNGATVRGMRPADISLRSVSLSRRSGPDWNCITSPRSNGSYRATEMQVGPGRHRSLRLSC